MAKLVLIDTGTKAPNNEIGDLVEVLDNSPVGPAYDSFNVVQITGVNVAEANQTNRAVFANIAQVYRTAATTNEWSFTEPENKRAWQDGATWKFLEKRPKYKTNYVFSAQDVTDLQGGVLTKTQKRALMSDRGIHNIKRFAENETEITELN